MILTLLKIFRRNKMKKQLLIAAVAATMSVSAMADISIAGAAKVNFTTVDFDGTTASTNDFKREMDLKITGKSGDTTVVMNFGNDTISGNDTTGSASLGLRAEDTYVATSIEGVSIKVGAWDNGNNALRASSRGDNKLSASTSFGGVKITYDASDESAGKVADTVKLSGDIAGVSASYKSVDNGEDIGLSTTVSGLSISYSAMNRDAANTDKSVVEVSGTFGGVGIKVASASTDTGTKIEGDTWMGDFEGNTSGAYMLSNGQDVTSLELSTTIAGNAVKFRTTDVDGVTGEDMSFNKVIVTRALSNGTTFEATYTDLDDSVAANDSSTLDLELAVKF
jgi:hypothetical protein